MILINILRGGLGNQLFQWAAAKKLETIYNCEIYYDITHLSGGGPITSRTFDLPQFTNLRLKILDDEGISKYYEKPRIQIDDYDLNILSPLLNENINYSLMGYWQNYIFLDEISEIIKQDLSCSDENKKVLFDKYPELNTMSVSIHIRRTDYLTSNGFHPVQPISYYERALEIIGDYDYLFIFSDDIEWCKDNLNFKNQIFVENNLPSVDIWLMSFCKHNVIANSSFSWWGAWLNNNQDKKVISPVNWSSSGDMRSLNPHGWIKI